MTSAGRGPASGWKRAPSSHWDGASTPSARTWAANAPSPAATVATTGGRRRSRWMSATSSANEPAARRTSASGSSGTSSWGTARYDPHAQPGRGLARTTARRAPEGAPASGDEHPGARHRVGYRLEDGDEVAARRGWHRHHARHPLRVVGAATMVPQHPGPLRRPPGGLGHEVAAVRSDDEVRAHASTSRAWRTPARVPPSSNTTTSGVSVRPPTRTPPRCATSSTA